MQRATRVMRVRASRLIGIGLALALTTLMSGVPELMTIVLGDYCCEAECEGSFGTAGCGPSCTQGSCAKSLSTVHKRELHVPRASLSAAAVVTAVSEPCLSPLPSSVFRPPRA